MKRLTLISMMLVAGTAQADVAAVAKALNEMPDAKWGQRILDMPEGERYSMCARWAVTVEGLIDAQLPRIAGTDDATWRVLTEKADAMAQQEGGARFWELVDVTRNHCISLNYPIEMDTQRLMDLEQIAMGYYPIMKKAAK